MGVGKAEQGGHGFPGFSHTHYLTIQNLIIFPFLVVNTGSILTAPQLKNFLPTPLAAAGITETFRWK